MHKDKPVQSTVPLEATLGHRGVASESIAMSTLPVNMKIDVFV